MSYDFLTGQIRNNFVASILWRETYQALFGFISEPKTGLCRIARGADRPQTSRI